uniref:Serine/threonine-protein kinase RIO2 n=1 Tax=Syphacia muris TaxID=451379 RepID=A0A0N5AMP0_9BILA
MGRFDVGAIRYLQKEHFRALVSVEMGMKNHELVPLQLVASIAGIHRGAVARSLSDLQKHRLVAYERGKRADGYRLTTTGYDFLALKALCSRGAVGSVGNQIGVGKESDVFVGGDPELNDLVLKFHRLGRTSFRKLKEKRDYHQRRKNCSWLYLSRLAASKEYAFLKALYSHKFPVPRPIDVSRHTVVMELIDGLTLCHVHSVDDVGALYDKLMNIIVRLGRYGLIHGDFNEFNIVLNSEHPILIDFPQMVSMDHPNAEFYFNRDVECIRTFFKKRFDYESELYPKFEDVERKYSLDVEVAASGFTRQMAKDLNAAYDSGDYAAIEDELLSSEESSCENEENADDERVESEEEKTNKVGVRYDSFALSSNITYNENITFLYTVKNNKRIEISRRIALEQRSRNKTKLRIKGKANAVRRGRKSNMSIIKEYEGWEF